MASNTADLPRTISTDRLKLTFIEKADIDSQELEWLHEVGSNEKAQWWRYITPSPVLLAFLTPPKNQRRLQIPPRNPPRIRRPSPPAHQRRNIQIHLRRTHRPQHHHHHDALHRPRRPPQHQRRNLHTPTHPLPPTNNTTLSNPRTKLPIPPAILVPRLRH